MVRSLIDYGIYGDGQYDMLPALPLIQSFSAHAWLLSKATCQVPWLKFPHSLPLMRINSIISGETVRMRRLV